MNKAITEGLVLMPPAFTAGLNLWSSNNGRPGDASYQGVTNAALPAQAAHLLHNVVAGGVGAHIGSREGLQCGEVKAGFVNEEKPVYIRFITGHESGLLQAGREKSICRLMIGRRARAMRHLDGESVRLWLRKSVCARLLQEWDDFGCGLGQCAGNGAAAGGRVATPPQLLGNTANVKTFARPE